MLEESNLLAALKQKDRALLKPLITECHLTAGETIYEPGQIVRYAYFPRGSALAVFLVLMENGEVVETTMVGREGAMGGIVSQGSVPSYARSCVMQSGDFYRISSADLEELKEQSPQIRNLFARYADCMMAQVFQSVACNASHTIEQRAAKWLCAALDRTGKDEISMTQEQLASMMGIGRSYASRVVQRFKADGLVQTRRGGLKVLDAQGLRSRACGCNDLVKQHFEIVLKGVYPNGD
jgi:CRP-like cAMP-binding protein